MVGFLLSPSYVYFALKDTKYFILMAHSSEFTWTYSNNTAAYPGTTV